MRKLNFIEKGFICGKLTTTGEVVRINNYPYYKCVCACGKETVASSCQLAKGGKKSCGCGRVEACRRNFLTHGHSAGGSTSKTYNAWASMVERCTNPKQKAFKYYGGRGIEVCQEWIDSFENFLVDMGTPPTETHSIDRIDVNGGYNKENCRWATLKEQARNKRNNHFLTINGETKTLSAWAEEKGIKQSIIGSRICNGWTPTDAVMKPLTKRKEPSRYCEIDGINRCVADWAKEWGLSWSAAKKRIVKYEKHKALSTPAPSQAVPGAGVEPTPETSNQS